MSEEPGRQPLEQNPPYRVRLPGFVSTDDVGLGDALKRVTTRFGIRPCGGCSSRAAALNRRVVITRWKPS